MTEITIEPVDVALEASLLNVMSLKQNFDLYNLYIDYKRVLPNTASVLKDYKKYYELYSEHEKINWDLFYTQFSQNWHAKDLENNDIEYYRDYVFKAIKEAENKDVESCLLGLMQRQAIDELNKGKFELKRLREVLDAYELKESKIIRAIDKEITTIANVDFHILDKAEGIPWFLPTLQNGLGSLVKGQLVVVAADFGTGKSAFVVSQAAVALEYSLKANKGCILYFNSEGTEADVFGRLCSNLFRKQLVGGFEQVVEKHDMVRQQFIKRYGEGKFLVSQIVGNSLDWVYKKILKYNPSLVIIDITDTLAKEEDVISLKKVFDQLRVISGVTCPIIATTQAGDQSYQDRETGEIKNRKWLGDKALYGAKTGKGGAADTIITIGRDDGNGMLRYVSTPKKKRGKAVNITCQLVEEYSLYEELAW